MRVVGAIRLRRLPGGLPDPFTDPKIAARRDHLVQEAELLLGTIDQHLPGAFDGAPDALAQIIRQGYFDAPHPT
jgi:hypothetical protein